MRESAQRDSSVRYLNKLKEIVFKKRVIDNEKYNLFSKKHLYN